MRSIDEITSRKMDGIDNDEDESCVVKRWFRDNPSDDDMIALFPLEWNEVMGEDDLDEQDIAEGRLRANNTQ